MIGTPIVKTELREGDDEYAWLEKEHREEITAFIDELERLRASRDMLLAAAKRVIHDTEDMCMLEFNWLPQLKAAIAAADGSSDETAARDFMAEHPHATSPSEE